MRGAHILLVEDEPELVHALGLRLQAAGYRVTSAGDGLAAVEACLRARPDLVLLDLVLPGDDGHAVLRRLGGLWADGGPPVVCVTARTDPDERQRALAAGAAAFVTKPFDGRALVALVGAHLDRAAAGAAAAPVAVPGVGTVLSGARLSPS
ncbi:MAG: response regulator [Candidatus Krumholzibacteriia bacterium]